jgi:chemotaxis protein methyltransferase CheR
VCPPPAEQRRLETLLAECRSALAADRCNAELHHLQGLVHEELGEIEAAREALRRALFLDPDCVVAHLALSRLCERQNHAAQAARHLANALELLQRRATAPERSPPTEAQAVCLALLARVQETAG